MALPHSFVTSPAPAENGGAITQPRQSDLPGKRPCRILHLEDNPDDAELVAGLLRRSGIACEIRLTQSRNAFVEALKSEPFDLVLADNVLPDMDGFRALDLVRKHDAAMPFIFLSGTLQEHEIADSARLDVTDCISKQRISHLPVAIRRMLRQLEERQERQRVERDLDRFFTVALDLFCVAGMDGYFKRVSPSWERVLGYSFAELLAEPFLNFVHPDDQPRTVLATERLRAGKVLQGFENRYRCRDGTYRWLQWNALPIPEQSATYAMARDVTQQHQAEEALRQSEGSLRALLESALDCIITTDAKGRIIEFNPAAERVFGYARQQVLGKDWQKVLLTAEGRNELQAVVGGLLTEGGGHLEGERIETRARRENNASFHAEITLTSFGEGANRRLAIFLRDITEEQEIRNEILKLAAFPRLNPNIVLEFAADGSLTYFNDAAQNIALRLGFSGVIELLPPGTTSIVTTSLRERHHQFTLQTKVGGRTIIWTFCPLPAVESVHCYAQDVTDRERAKEKIQQQAELLDIAQDAILVRDLDNRVTYWNKGAERLYGWSAGEAIGHSALELASRSNPEEFLKAREKFDAQGSWSGELKQFTRDGREVIVQSRWTRIHDHLGQPKATFVISSDITEKKQLQAQFLRAQRLESIGALASGIAHDLNNVLAPILMSVSLLRDAVTDPGKARLIETVKLSAQRGADMVRQILSFTRGREESRCLLDVKHLVNEVAKIARETFPKNIHIRTRVGKRLEQTLGDPTQIHQVLMNLCVNARDAMPKGGELTIAIDAVTVEQLQVRGPLEPQPGRYIAISVRDTGTGMPPEILEQIFKPFFTSKEPDKGTGLGLATVANIVQQHSGFIHVESEPERGSTFQFFLPIARREQSPPTPAPVAALPAGHGETILLVDDEHAVLELTRAMLLRYGYQVLTAADGAEALALFAQHKEEIHLVITDMMMPFLDGPATIRALRKLQPGVPVLAISGLAQNRGGIERFEDVDFLAKPFTAEELLGGIHEALNRAAAAE